MRILNIRERRIPISRYADPSVPPGGLDTSIVAVTTDVVRGSEPVTGFGFASIGRFAQGGLIRERFAPRLSMAGVGDLVDSDTGNLDPFRAWDCMMADEKTGGHGERSVAVGALDMAIWDAAAKIAELPLYQLMAGRLGRPVHSGAVPVYASGGYPYPQDDSSRLEAEISALKDWGYTHVKIKIGAGPLETDLSRIERVLKLLPDGSHLAVDAMNRFDRVAAERAAVQLQPFGLRWFEDICDPLDYETQSEIGSLYPHPIAAGEALFSREDAVNLIRYGGLRAGRDVLVFDPVHCYGVPGYLRIIEAFEQAGWARTSFQPHGGHLFALHLVAALGLGGAESNPHNFQPFGGFTDAMNVSDGMATLPDAVGIGFEKRGALSALFQSLVDG